jgi:hypothetical protein
MEALSAPTIGNNVQLALVRGAQERLVAALATAQAGCTPGIRGWALGIREALRLSIRWWPVRNQTPEVDLYFSDTALIGTLKSSTHTPTPRGSLDAENLESLEGK